MTQLHEVFPQVFEDYDEVCLVRVHPGTNRSDLLDWDPTPRPNRCIYMLHVPLLPAKRGSQVLRH